MFDRFKESLVKTLAGQHLHDLRQHRASAQAAADQSYGNEMQLVLAHLRSLGITTGFAVDMAASDGLTQSSTYSLFRDGWSGLCVEMDPDKFSKLAFLYREFEPVRLVRHRITPPNVADIFRAAEVPQGFEFLNLDIDSYDLRVIEAILGAGYAPCLVSMEINEKIPPELFFTVEYDPAHYWKGDHFFGCSIGAAHSVLSGLDYVLIGMEWNNAFFIPRSLAAEKGIAEVGAVGAYDAGYRNRPGRAELFPWNADVDGWLDQPPEEAARLIAEKFRAYRGRFTCQVI